MFDFKYLSFIYPSIYSSFFLTTSCGTHFIRPIVFKCFLPSWGSLKNTLSIFHEQTIRYAYIFPSLDPDFVGFN